MAEKTYLLITNTETKLMVKINSKPGKNMETLKLLP